VPSRSYSLAPPRLEDGHTAFLYFPPVVAAVMPRGGGRRASISWGYSHDVPEYHRQLVTEMDDAPAPGLRGAGRLAPRCVSAPFALAIGGPSPRAYSHGSADKIAIP
jgi:hypothetical protein